ncbi:polysaccharide transporter [Psychromonas sp. MB-3u-54]|uniref:oligosaccharide flippase family protein n=1 Tax=Psychromonas sp. MB-3u-54 TaxID=2058319 RepID=UPI000C349C41|nr:oligosaccharide flippase family protein [Psychromonas sp. MB-3u-54]PKH03016.1 polysaccharide transporter [Psychromonas sp. MB-3u-54]
MQGENRRLLDNTTWLLLTEIAGKISRVLVILALAAHLSAIEYGTVMLALACHEVLKLMLRSGAGTQIIQCSDDNLKEYAKNGAILQWVVCLSLAGIQSVLAKPIGDFYSNPAVTQLLVAMAGVYLLYPLVSIKVFLIHRASNMRFYSVRNASCILAENLTITLFAIFDFGIMSVVYGKWVFGLMWVCLFYFAPVKHFGIGFDLSTFLVLCRTSGQLLLTELARALRMQLDMLIGARLLSPEMFGLYSFAKSAGVGLSQSLNNAFNSALYPYLCDKHRQGQLSQHICWIYLVTTAVALLFLLQAIAVPFYVPLLFDQQWQQQYLVISLLCLAALSGLYVDTHCNILRSQGAYQYELYVRLFCLVISTVGLLIFQTETPETLALVVLANSTTWLLVLFFKPPMSQNISPLKSLSIRTQTNE